MTCKDTKTASAYYETKIGRIKIVYTDCSVCGISLSDETGESVPSPLSDLAFRQISEYLDGKRKSFDLPISFSCTPFSERVFRALSSVPYGSIITYKSLAASCGSPNACRAVGNALHNNPVFIVIPCHRVVSSDGKRGGFAYGASLKKFLLDLESASF